MTAGIDGHLLPSNRHAGAPAVARPERGASLVHRGAELVELSERFYAGAFVGGIVFVGLAGVAALGLLPLRQSEARYDSVTVVITALLVAATPLAVARAGALYRVLRRREPTHLVIVAVAAALVVSPLRSELWWPSCALLMLLATLAPLRRILGYCVVVLLANLAAHVVAGDIGTTPPVTIIGLWVGYVFWSSSSALFVELLAAHVLRLNTHQTPSLLPPLKVDTTDRSDTQPRTDVARDAAPSRADVTRAAAPATTRLTARQLQVVVLLADGLRYDEVAACLAISVRQVGRHVSNAIDRLGLHNANELIAVAVADGLVLDDARR